MKQRKKRRTTPHQKLYVRQYEALFPLLVEFSGPYKRQDDVPLPYPDDVIASLNPSDDEDNSDGGPKGRPTVTHRIRSKTMLQGTSEQKNEEGGEGRGQKNEAFNPVHDLPLFPILEFDMEDDLQAEINEINYMIANLEANETKETQRVGERSRPLVVYHFLVSVLRRRYWKWRSAVR
jgi:hypothetical protein